MASRLNVLLVEPFLTGSHRQWAEGLAAHSRHRVHLVSHEGAFWKWRMQGAALTLAAQISQMAERPDVLLVSDMVHVPALIGLARPHLDHTPVVLYMHENQLTYPLADGADEDHTYAMTNWLSMAAADRVVFNSEHHRRELFAALPRFLRRFPDYRHSARVHEVEARSTVLPVGIDVVAGDRRSDPPLVLWNHRWEHDKDPAAAFAALKDVAGRGSAFRLAIAGQQFQAVPEEFADAAEHFADRLVQFGTVDRPAYEALLQRADIVLSTAVHEFLGLSVLEAAAAGACPVLPNRLSYPEVFPAECLYEVDPADLLADLLGDHPRRRAIAAAAQQRAAAFDWSVVAPRYDELLSDVSVRSS